jgi:parallel beta-helix repeat protein
MKAIYIVCVIALLGAMMVAPAAATTWYVHDGESIQAAIDSASSGDTVFVYNGSYIGGFELNTPNITVKGEGADVVTIDVGGSNVNVNVNSPGCIIEGIKIVNIYLSKIMSPNCIVRNCIYDGVSGTITIDGSATNTTFENNVVTNGTFEYSVVYLKGDNSTVAKNSIINNKCTSETSSRAVCIKEASNCTVVNNTITGNNGDGIRLWKSSTANNIIKRNNISANTRCGIYLKDAGSGNRIYLNDIVDNPTSVIYYGVAPATIYWNSTEPIEYTYGGAIHTNYLGNCWGSDYTGGDGDGDGLGDVPYDITGSATDKDHRPLMEGFENYPALAGAADPDLTPTSIATDSLSAGVPAAITVDVSNIGSAEAGSFNVTLKVEDTVIGSDTVVSRTTN